MEIWAWYFSMASSSMLSPNTSTSVDANFLALTFFSNKRSSSANVRPVGSGTRKYVYTRHKKHKPAYEKHVSWLLPLHIAG